MLHDVRLLQEESFMALSPEQLLAELGDLIRTLPPASDLAKADVTAWTGRACAVMHQWDPRQAVSFDSAVRALGSGNWNLIGPALKDIPSLLHRARYDVLLKSGNSGTKVVDKGEVFDYFDELRKVVQQARTALLFVDPYANEDFVASYFPFVPAGVSVRVLGRENMKTLVPALEMFAKQHSLKAEARSGSGFHDRFVFVDDSACYQSGASFHQGGARTPTTLTPMVDAAATLLGVYNGIWASSK